MSLFISLIKFLIKKINVNLYEKDNLEDIHNYLYYNKVSITYRDYRKSLRKATIGEFVYLAPTYNETFTAYTKNDFNRDDQQEYGASIWRG